MPKASPDTVSSTQIRSGDIASGSRVSPSRHATTHSFWKAISSRAAAVLVEPVDDRAAAQKPLGRAARDVDDLAAEQLLAAGLVEDRGDRVLVPALRLAHPAADADRLRGR